MISIKEFKQKWNLSYNQIKLMIPLFEGVEECPCCHGKLIPENTIPYYVPDKRKYKKVTDKKYFYILDAIGKGFLIHSDLTGINKDDCKSRIPELRKLGLITLKNGIEESVDYRDYLLTAKYLEWEEKQNKWHKDMVLSLANNLENLTEILSKMFII